MRKGRVFEELKEELDLQFYRRKKRGRFRILLIVLFVLVSYLTFRMF